MANGEREFPSHAAVKQANNRVFRSPYHLSVRARPCSPGRPGTNTHTNTYAKVAVRDGAMCGVHMCMTYFQSVRSRQTDYPDRAHITLEKRRKWVLCVLLNIQFKKDLTHETTSDKCSGFYWGAGVPAGDTILTQVQTKRKNTINFSAFVKTNVDFIIIMLFRSNWFQLYYNNKTLCAYKCWTQGDQTSW